MTGTVKTDSNPTARPAIEAISDPQGRGGQTEAEPSPIAARPSPAGA
ncbi:hypothetical protein GCM10010295_01750 [Streptomyces intermedius]